MLMHNSGRYVRLCVRPTILILFKVYMYCFLDFFVLNFLKFLNKLCFMEQMDYGAVLPPSQMVFFIMFLVLGTLQHSYCQKAWPYIIIISLSLLLFVVRQRHYEAQKFYAKKCKNLERKTVLQQISININIKKYLVFGRKYLEFEIVSLVNLILE